MKSRYLLGGIFTFLMLGVLISCGIEPKVETPNGTQGDDGRLVSDVTPQPAPAGVILELQAILESGDLDAAGEAYKQALQNYPKCPTLNFAYALTLIPRIVSDTNVHAFLEELGITGIPDKFDDLMRAMQNGTLDILLNGAPIENATNWDSLFNKNISDYQNLIDQSIVDKINKALDALYITEAEPNFSFKLNVKSIVTNWGMGWSDPVSVYTFEMPEVCLYDALLSTLGGLLNFINAQNLDVDIQAMRDMTESDGPEEIRDNYYNPFSNPNFGTLKPDGAALYGKTKNLWIRTTTRIIYGVNKLQNRNYAGGDTYVIPEEAKQDPEILNDIKKYSSKLKSSLEGNYVDFEFVSYYYTCEEYYDYELGEWVCEETLTPYTNGVYGISIGKYLDSGKGVRDLLFELDNSGEPKLYDPDNKTLVTAPEDGESYLFKLKDPTFGGLFRTSSEIFGSTIQDFEYIPAIWRFNTEYPVWLNVFGIAPRPPIPMELISELSDAVDLPDEDFYSYGDAHWFRTTDVSYYGGDSAQSGNITHDEFSAMSLTFTGTGISFYWKVSSENGWDYLIFKIGDDVIEEISGEVDWEQVEVTGLTPGEHTATWIYEKDGSVSYGDDCGWVDQVVVIE